MDAERSAGEEEDPVVRLSRELAKVNASLERAHVQHEAIRERLGTRAPPPTKIARKVVRPDVGSGAYRGKDRAAELQHAVDEAKKALALLRDENSTLESQCDMVFPDPPFAERPLGKVLIVLVVLAAIFGFTWVGVKYGGDKAGGMLTTVSILVYVFVRVFRTPSSEKR